MTACIYTYTLSDVEKIQYDGFDYKLPDETVKLIHSLATQVGSPSYIKTPIFQKRENIINNNNNSNNNSNNKATEHKKRKPRDNISGTAKDAHWETLRTFQVTKIEQKVGIDAEMDLIRSYLNKMTDKNFQDMKTKIMDALDKIFNEESYTASENTNVMRILFEIASTNRFFSKLYAELYGDLMKKYEFMNELFETCFQQFMSLFSTIEYADPDVDYNKFCKINKINENRKALSLFFVNLYEKGLLEEVRIINLLDTMLKQVIELIKQENKKYVVDELTENIAILYGNETVQRFINENKECVFRVIGVTQEGQNVYTRTPGILDENKENVIDIGCITKSITELAKSKATKYPSLTNKSIFKYMDLMKM